MEITLMNFFASISYQILPWLVLIIGLALVSVELEKMLNDDICV